MQGRSLPVGSDSARGPDAVTEPARKWSLRIPGIPPAALPWLRVVVSLGILALIASQIDFGEFLSLTLGGSLPGMVLAYLVGLTLLCMAAYRWYFLIGPSLGLSFLPFLNLTFVSTFVGLFLPGTVGIEVIRVVGLARLRVPVAVAGTSLLVDRLLSIFAQFALALGLLAVFPLGLPPATSLWAVAAMVALVTGAVLVMSPRYRALVRWVLSFGILRRLAGLSEKVFDALDAYRDRRRMTIAFGQALLFQMHRAVFLWTCAHALGVEVGLLHLLIALPVVGLVEMIPLTLAGVGTREAAFALVLRNFGILPAEAVAISLLAFFIGTVLGSLPGGLIFARSGLGRTIPQEDMMPRNQPR